MKTFPPWWESTLLNVSRRGAQIVIDELLDHKLTPRFRLGKDGNGQGVVFVRLCSSSTGSGHIFRQGYGPTSDLALDMAIANMRVDLNSAQAR